MIAAVTLAAVGLLTAALAGTWGGARATLWYDDLITAGAAAGAAVAVFGIAVRRDPDRRRFWVYLGAALVAWAVGEMLWAVYELGPNGEVPFPSFADVGYLAAIPCAAAALVQSPALPSQRTRRIRLILDGVIVAGGTLFVAWGALLGPLYEHREGDLLQVVIALSYPLGDVLVITLATAAMIRSHHPWRTPLPFVAAGIGAIALSDAAYAYLTQVRGYQTGTAIDAGWVAGYALLGLAALRPPTSAARREERPTTTANILLLYAPIVIGLVVATDRILRGARLDPMLWMIGVVTVAVVVARQIVAVTDNTRLSRTLEDKVRTRTAELARERERFRSLVQHSSDLTFVIDTDGRVTFASDNVRSALGSDATTLVGGRLADIVHPDDRSALAGALVKATATRRHRAKADWRMVAHTTGWRSFEAVLTDHTADDAIGGIIINARDVTDRRRLEDELRHQAFHDPLTGLANRALFADRVEHALVRADRTPGAPAVLFLDLDDFKTVNDTTGHGAGDRVLRQIAARIATAVRASDTVARLGGDEFAVLLETLDDSDQPLRIAQRIQAAIGERVSIGARDVLPRVSIGIAFTNDDARTGEDLLRRADVAMYVAKADGKALIRTYDESIGRSIVDRLTLEAELPAAVANGELVVYYQPLVELRTGRLVGMEALVRWEHPTRGLVPPDAFIPAAEQSGLIVDIGRDVLATACRQAADWLHDQPDLELAVNLSPRQLVRPDLADEVAAILADTGFPAANLVLEITETVVIGDGHAITHALQQLADLGIRLAIDDFGTGYSSLSYLSQLPVHALKIDRSFVAGLSSGEQRSAVVETIVRLARDLDLDTVAEGVETQDIADLLTDLGCHLAQGYLYAKPLPPDEFTKLVRGRRGARVLSRCWGQVRRPVADAQR